MANISPEKKIKLDIPVLDELAQGIISDEKGIKTVNLNAAQVNELMSQTVAQLLKSDQARQFGVNAKVSSAFKITENKGDFAGTVVIASPISATISVGCTLENDPNTKGKIRLSQPVKIEERPDGFKAGIALKAINLKKLAGEQLQDPTKAFGIILADQLEQRRVQFIKMMVGFEDNQFRATVAGKPISK